MVSLGLSGRRAPGTLHRSEAEGACSPPISQPKSFQSESLKHFCPRDTYNTWASTDGGWAFLKDD